MGRIADVAKRYWAQDFQRWITQMIANTMQYMDEEIIVRMTPDMERDFAFLFPDQKPLILSREELQDVYIDIEPYDPRSMENRASEVQAWQQIFQTVAADPELRQQFNLQEMLKIIAQKTNVRGLEKVMVVPPPAIPQQGEIPVVPLNGGPPISGPQSPAMELAAMVNAAGGQVPPPVL